VRHDINRARNELLERRPRRWIDRVRVAVEDLVEVGPRDLVERPG
jgi:hypothetical protein